MKRALVCGGGGFIGRHLVTRLKAEGHFVRALGRSPYPESDADEYWTCDLREPHPEMFHNTDEVYQLACEVGGLGYIMDRGNDADCLRNSTLIDINVLEACRQNEISCVFFASSACVYNTSDSFFAEHMAYPARPINEFAWQKLFAERLYRAYAENYGLQVRIGRLFNTYGIGMPWTGGREKSVAALCRKIAEAKDGDTVEIWGDGYQRRSFTHVDDAVEGIWRLMQSDYEQPVNIGAPSAVIIRKLAETIAEIAGKRIEFRFDRSKPEGVARICCDTKLLQSVLGWQPQITVEEGLQTAYPWIKEQVDKAQQT